MAGAGNERSADRFRPRLGRPRAAGDLAAGPKATRFVSQVIRAANRAGPVPLPPRPGAAKLARGSTVARLIGQGRARAMRRVTVKVRLVHLAKAGARSIASHLTYIQRDAVGREGRPGQAYGRDGAVDVEAFEEAGKGDRHQFRLIVAPEDGEALGDLQAYTRELMAQVEQDLGTRLDWIAVDHHDTGHCHSHVVLRGADDRGRDLVIARDYVAHGLRARGSEIATAWLGPRTEKEIAAGLDRDATADRWTGLDQRLDRLTGCDRIVGVDRMTAAERSHLRERLRHLERLGLATDRDGQWQLSPRHQPTLRALGERGDIIRTMQRAMAGQARELTLTDQSNAGQPVIGRIAAKGLVDELGDQGWLAIDGIDGRAHYCKLPARSDLASWPVGGIVELRGGERAVDREIAAATTRGLYMPPAGADDGATRTRDSAVRRLEALRRAGIVERLGHDSWRIPDDLVVRATAHDRAAGRTPLLRSPIDLDAQVKAIGATWLDRDLVEDSKGGLAPHSVAHTGFGAEVRRARDSRLSVLESEGLATRVHGRALLASNLLVTLEARDLADAGQTITAETGLAFRPVGAGRVNGTLARLIDRPSGRFAMLDDGSGGFALVPWRPIIEHRIGQSVAATFDGARVNWLLGRARSRGV